MDFVHFKTPDGHACVRKSDIIGVIETEAEGLYDTTIRARIYVRHDPESFNSTTTYEMIRIQLEKKARIPE